MSTVIVSQTIILPDDMPATEVRHSWYLWAVYVRWQNPLGWTVTTMDPEERLSVKGREWVNYAPERNRRFYYFSTYEEAVEVALEEVNNRTVMGQTWTEAKKTWRG